MILSYKNISKALMLSVFMISSGYGHDHLDGHHHDGSHHDGCNHDHQVEQSNQQGGDHDKLPQNMDKMLEELLAGLLMQQQGFDQAGNTQGAPTGGRGMHNLDQDSLVKLVFEMYNQHREEALRKKRELLDILPETMKCAVVSSCESYENIASRINICATLQGVIEIIGVGLRDGQKTGLCSEVDCEALLLDLQNLYQSVVSGGFTKIIQGIPQSQDLPMPINPLDVSAMATSMGAALQPVDDKSLQLQQGELLTVDSIIILTEKLGVLLSNHAVELDENLRKNIEMLHDILGAVGTQKVDVIAKTYFKYLLVSLDSTESELRDAMALLKIALDERKIDAKNEKYTIANFSQAKSDKASADELLNYALAIWFRDLKRYKNTIGVFKALESSVKPGKNPKTSLFRALSYSYDFMKDMYDIYGKDTFGIGFFNDSSNFFQYKMPVALTDWMLRAGMAGWYYSDMSAENTKGVVLNAMTGGLQLKSLTPVQQLIYKFAAVPLALPILYKPSFWFKQPHEILVAARKTLASWVYYHVVYRHLKDTQIVGDMTVVDQYGQEQRVHGPHFLLAGQGTFEGHGNYAHRVAKLWDKNYSHTKAAIFNGVAEINRILCRNIHEEIRGTIDPGVLYTIHQYTWGIVKPEIIGYFAQALLPLLFIKQPLGLGEVVNCNANDVYSGYWRQRVRVQRDAWAQRDGQFNEHAFYVEQQMLSYIFSSVGNFWGNKVATTYKTQIMNGLGHIGSFILDLCEAAGLISEDQNNSVQEAKDELVMDLDENLAMLKMLIQSVFAPNSSFRHMIIMQLRERDYLDENTVKDHVEINKIIVEFVLTRMSEAGLINYLDAATLVNTYKDNPEDTAWIVDKTVDVIKQSLIGQFGGYVGSWLLTEISQWLSWQTGPLYPRIKNAIF